MTPPELVVVDGRTLAIIVRAEANPARTTFVTEPTATLQVGYVVYGANTAVPRHSHVRVERKLDVTAEVIFVKSGRCTVDVYDDPPAHTLVDSVELRAGDGVVLLAGGHGFRMHEPTVLIEVKQGPYQGVDEKLRF
jgi:hypothetical protein